MSIKYVCDRCGSTAENLRELEMKWTEYDMSLFSDRPTYHLCNTCFDDFRQFIKQQPIT